MTCSPLEVSGGGFKCQTVSTRAERLQPFSTTPLECESEAPGGTSCCAIILPFVVVLALCPRIDVSDHAKSLSISVAIAELWFVPFRGLGPERRPDVPALLH